MVIQLEQGAEQVLTDTVGILLSKQATQIDKMINIANTLMARDYKGFGNQGMNGVLEIEKLREGRIKVDFVKTTVVDDVFDIAKTLTMNLRETEPCRMFF